MGPSPVGEEARVVRPLLFDVDGTLVDSRDAVTAVWRQVADCFGVDAEAILRVCHGRRDEDVVAEFFAPDLTAGVLDMIAELELACADEVAAMPGADALLASLPAGAWAAVTSGSRVLMTARLRAAGLAAPVVLIAADDVGGGKPDPEGFLLAARQLGVEANDCVVVEDAPAGVSAGKAAGAYVVAVSTTHPAEVLWEADTVVNGLPDLSAVLSALPRLGA